MDFDMKVRGLDKLGEALRTVDEKLRLNTLRGALRAGGKVMVVAAKEKAEFADNTGELRNSIRVAARLRNGVPSATVKAGNKKAWYAGWVEDGTQPHQIEPNETKALSFSGVIAETVDHPGASAKPFMRPTMDEQGQETLAAVAEYLRDRLARNGIDVPADDGDDPEE